MVYLAFIESHLAIGDLKPNAYAGETEKQARQTASETDPDNREDG